VWRTGLWRARPPELRREAPIPDSGVVLASMGKDTRGMSFLVLPPEMNSALMHAGAGSGPMLAAAAAWLRAAADRRHRDD
jgi:hypothetical protein